MSCLTDHGFSAWLDDRSCQITLVDRFESIQITYLNLQGENALMDLPPKSFSTNTIICKVSLILIGPRQ